MIHWTNASIRSKLILSIVVVAAISLLLGLGINVLQDIQSYKDDLRDQAETLTQIVGDYSQAALDFGDSSAAADYLEKLKSNNQILAARLLLADNRFFVSYGKADLLEGLEAKDFSVFKSNTYFISRRIIQDGIPYGTIQIAYSTSTIKTKIYNQVLNMIVVMVVMLMIAFLAAIKVEQNIQGPLFELVKMADEISKEEDYSLRLERQSDDEIGSLYDSFNNMLNVIQNREKHLQVREMDFRNIFNSQHDAIFIHDNKGRILDVNKTMQEMYGVTYKEAINMDIEKDFSSEDNNFGTLVTYWAETLQGIPHELDWKAKRPHDHSIFDVQMNLQRVEHRGEMAILAIIRDITLRKQMEAEVRESEVKFRNLIEHLQDGVYVFCENRLLIINNKFRDMLELGSVIQPGDTFKLEDYIPESNRNDYLQKIEELKDRKTKEIDFEFSIHPKVGRNRQVEASFSLIAIENVIAIQGILRDVTDKKSLEEQFRQSQKMEAVGRLAGGVAHDFNNILTVINGYCDMLMKQTDLSPFIVKSVGQIHNSGKRAARLTRQLLAFSRKQVIQPKTINVNKEIHDLYSMLVRLIGEDIQIKTLFAPDISPITIDLGQLEQVLLNITVNARDAMPQGGTLTIETANVQFNDLNSRTHFQIQPGDYVMISLSDTGIGMDEQTKSRIFEPFFSTKALGKGTGLGLSMVYGIIQQNKGHVWVYSEPGLGTTFKCFFPAEHHSNIPDALTENEDMVLDGRENLLIVEDNLDLFTLLQSVFEDLHYKVSFAENGEQGFAKALEMEQIDLLLTDVVMPGKSGPELADELLGRFPDMKVLFMSGYTGNELIQEKLTDDDFDFIQKPFTPNDLLKTLRNLLDFS